MSNIYDQFNKSFDSEQLKSDVAEVDANDGKREYVEVPVGTYEISVSHLELKASKAGDPMVSCRLKILDGEFKNQIIFYNQVVKEKFGLHFAKKFLASLETDIEVTYEDWVQFGTMIEDIDAALEGAEFALKYDKNKSGYPTYEIVKRFK